MKRKILLGLVLGLVVIASVVCVSLLYNCETREPVRAYPCSDNYAEATPMYLCYGDNPPVGCRGFTTGEPQPQEVISAIYYSDGECHFIWHLGLCPE